MYNSVLTSNYYCHSDMIVTPLYHFIYLTI